MPRDSAPRPKRRPRRRLVACALAAIGLVGLGTGSASQVSLASTAVAAGSVVTAPCQGATPVQAVFTSTYNTASGKYRATGVTLSGFNAACNGRPYQLRILTGATTTVGNTDFGGVISGGSSEAETFTATDVDLITSVAVVVS